MALPHLLDVIAKKLAKLTFEVTTKNLHNSLINVNLRITLEEVKATK